MARDAVRGRSCQEGEAPAAEEALGNAARLFDIVRAQSALLPDDRVPWVKAFSEVLDAYAGPTARQCTDKWRAIFDDARFRHVASQSYPFAQPMNREGVINRALSTSFIAALPQGEQARVRERIAAVIDSEPSLTDPISFPYVTEFYLFAVQH